MVTIRIILGFCPTPFFMGQVWFNCNRVYNEFEFIFLNPRWIWDEFRYYYLDYICKIFLLLFYFIL